jgi:hypothetical protein
VTHKNVEVLLGRLATDRAFRRRFLQNPASLVRDFQQQGFELTAIEAEALASTDGAAIRAFASAVDRRLRRVEVGASPEAQSE